MEITRKIPPSEVHRFIVESLNDVVFYITIQNGEFFFDTVNASFLKVTGLHSNQVIGKNVLSVIPPESAEMVMKNYHKAINEKRAVHWREVSNYPMGKKYGDVSVSPLFHEDGSCYALLGSVHDITPIVETDQQFRMVMERISDGVVALDRDMNYTFANKSAGQILGKEPDDLIGRNYWTEYPEARGTSFAKAYEEAFKTQKNIEVLDLYPDWGRWFENRIFPNENGITVFFSDVTERVHRIMDLENAKKAAEEALVAKSSFLDIAAHELRNPTTTMYLMIQSLKRKIDKGGEIDPQKISDLLIPAERLNRLVVELLDLSRLEKNLIALELEDVDLRKLISGWIKELLPMNPHRKISFDDSGKAIFLKIDPLRIYQVFSNILENAFKYTPESTPIEIVLRQSGDFEELFITDHGAGMTEESLSHIFEAFHRGSLDIKDRHTGLGLGLSISQQIMKLHGGDITVKSKPGQGSTFILRFPLKSEMS